MKNQGLKIIARSAILIALLIVVQYATQSFGQYVTGSAVNLILIVSATIAGLYGSLAVALLSPVFAFLLGIGPQIIGIIPFIMIGNAVLVLVWYFLTKALKFNVYISYAVTAVIAAALKFGALYIGVVKIAVNILPDLKPAQIDKFSAMFSFPQLITALIGGALAVIIVPILKKAIK